MAKPSKVYRSRLAEELDTTVATVKYYTELGLLPYELHDPDNRDSNRLYDIEVCQKRWNDIQKMKEDGKNVPEIVLEFVKRGDLDISNSRVLHAILSMENK